MARPGALGGYIQPLDVPSDVAVTAASTGTTPVFNVTFRFSRVGGIVTMQTDTAVSVTFTALSSPVFTGVVPVGYRPSKAASPNELRFPVQMTSGVNLTIGSVVIDALGTVVMLESDSSAFPQASFQIAPFCVSWT
jgi:hypothetical protein